LDFGHRVGGAVFNSGFPSHDWMGRDSGVKVLADTCAGNKWRQERVYSTDGITLGEVCMSITPYLCDFEVDLETKRVLSVALEMTRVSLGLADDFANGIIAKRIIELAKAGECNPDLLCQGAIEQLRGHLYGSGKIIPLKGRADFR
jgi:hypothetical protein